MRPISIVTIGILVCFTISHAKRSEEEQRLCNSVQSEIGKVTNVLRRVLQYLEDDPTELNLDATSAIRMGEGALLTVQSHMESTGDLYGSDLNGLTAQIGRIAKIASQRLLHQGGSTYNQQFRVMVAHPFPFPASWRSLKPKPTPEVSVQGSKNNLLAFSEAQFDRCYVDIIGTGQNHTQCDISRSCALKATNNTVSKGYTLTHRVLYFYLLKMFGCERAFLSYIAPRTMNLENYRSDLCSIALGQHESILLKSKVKKLDVNLQDLFLEQAVLCGLFGFDNFFQSANTHLALQWQENSLGCYGIRNKFTSRKLLYEKIMHGGCSAHETGLAVAYFSMNLNYLFKLSERCALGI